MVSLVAYLVVDNPMARIHSTLIKASWHGGPFRITDPLLGEFTTHWWISHTKDSKVKLFMMMSSNGNIFRVTGPLCGEFTGDRWIPLTKASDTELWCFRWSAPWINGWVNNHEAGDLRRHRAHYEVIVIYILYVSASACCWATSCQWFETTCRTFGVTKMKKHILKIFPLIATQRWQFCFHSKCFSRERDHQLLN